MLKLLTFKHALVKLKELKVFRCTEDTCFDYCKGYDFDDMIDSGSQQ